MKLNISATFLLLVFGCWSVPSYADRQAILQVFSCSGMMKSLTILEDPSRRDGRQLRRVYVDDSIGNEFVVRVANDTYISYQYEGNTEEIRYFTKERRLEFWEGGARVPEEMFAKCVPQGDEMTASVAVRETKQKAYICGDEIVTVTQESPNLVRVKTSFRDGTSSEDFMNVVISNGITKWITEESQRREKTTWGKSQGAGFSSFHKRYDEKTDRIESWSQGGGNMEPAKAYQVCTRKN